MRWHIVASVLGTATLAFTGFHETAAVVEHEREDQVAFHGPSKRKGAAGNDDYFVHVG